MKLLKSLLKVVGLILILSVVCGAVLGGCFFYRLLVRPEFSQEFTLSEEDYADFEAAAAEFEESVIEDKNELVVIMKNSKFTDSFFKIDAQRTVAYINYCKDMTNEKAVSDYEFAIEIYNKASNLYNETLKNILLSDSSIAAQLFAEWSDEEKELILNNNERAYELTVENEDILLDYRALDDEAEGWADTVDGYYLQIVKNNNAIAKEYGYANYYEYASWAAFSRYYSDADRNRLREYVKEYIIPLFPEVLGRLESLGAEADEQTLTEYRALMSESYKSNEDVKRYIADYVDSFYVNPDDLMENMGDCMGNMLEGDLAIFADGENAMKAAFTGYMNYYGTPVAFFGPGYQDMLTIVHEAGHFAVFDRTGFANMPLDFCEVHSQANEWMFIAYLEDQLDPEVYELVKLNRLARGLEIIILATAVDECEESIYRAIDENSTVQQIGALISETLSGYGEKIIEDLALESYVRHVVLESPVYYLSYATSEIVSLTSFLEAQDNLTEAQKSYTKFADESLLPEVVEKGLKEAFEEATYVNIVREFSPEENGGGAVSYCEYEHVLLPAA